MKRPILAASLRRKGGGKHAGEEAVAGRELEETSIAKCTQAMGRWFLILPN